MAKKTADNPVLLITGTRKGIGRALAEHFLKKGYSVAGCSREPGTITHPAYKHFCLDVADEKAVEELHHALKAWRGRLDGLINNAGIASMNHTFLTPASTVERILKTNVLGTFLFCREAGKIMQRQKSGRIINFATVATPLQLEGEAAYAASKAAIVSLTQILARELSSFGITVNAVGPTPVKTDLIKSVPADKMQRLLQRQALPRYGELADIVNVIEFFLRPESAFVTGQVVYLGGVS